MEAKAQQTAEEESQRRKDSKLNNYKGYGGVDVWGTETADPASIDPKKVSITARRQHQVCTAALSAFLLPVCA